MNALRLKQTQMAQPALMVQAPLGDKVRSWRWNWYFAFGDRHGRPLCVGYAESRSGAKTDPAFQLRVRPLIACPGLSRRSETSAYTRRTCSTGDHKSGFGKR